MRGSFLLRTPWLLSFCATTAVVQPPTAVAQTPAAVAQTPSAVAQTPTAVAQTPTAIAQAGAAELEATKLAGAEPEAPPKPLPQAQSRWANQLYQRVQPSIVLIRTRQAEGTGFLFHSNRHIATAFHVVSEGQPIRVILASGQELAARVVAWDEEWDIALLELAQPLNAPVLEQVSTGHGQVGDPVVALGNPWGAEERKRPGSSAPVWALSQGVISAPPSELIQTDAPVNPGNSGGPLLTQQGEVVGVLVVRVAGSDGISFAVSCARLKALATTLGRQPEYQGPGNRLDWQLGWVPVAEHELSGVIWGPRYTFRDWAGISLRGARLWGGTEVISTLSLQERNRWLLEADAYLLLVSSESLSIPLGVGVAASVDAIEERVAMVTGGALQEATTKRTVTDFRLLGSFGFAAENVLFDTSVYAFGKGGWGARLGINVVF
jgi:putative serine protease PepD